MTGKTPLLQENYPKFQKMVHDYITQYDMGYWSHFEIFLRLVEEIGELAKSLNEVHGQKAAKNKADEHALREELADCFFTLAALANSEEINLMDALEEVIEKYQVRDHDRWSQFDNKP